MGIQKEFGGRVRELRKRAGMTQAQLAAKCGRTLEMQHIGEIERGERNCTLQTIESLAKGLKCEPVELFLFRSPHSGRSHAVLDARLSDLWKAANEQTKQKVIRIISELL